MITFDLSEYLKSKLSNDFIISNVRQLNGNFSDNTKHNVTVIELASNVLTYSATLNYQIDINTADPITASNAFKTLIANENNKKFVEDSMTIIPFFTTPTPMGDNSDVGTNTYVRLVVFATINIMYNVNDIVSAKVGDESIEILSTSIAYVATSKSKKLSGVEINKNVKEIAGVVINMRFVPSNSLIFVNSLSRIRQGTLSGDTHFTIALTFTNGAVETYTAIVLSHTLATNRGQIPAMDISFGVA